MNIEDADKILDYLYGTFSGFGPYKECINQITKLNKIEKMLDEVINILNSKFRMKFEWKINFDNLGSTFLTGFCILGVKSDWNFKYDIEHKLIEHIITDTIDSEIISSLVGETVMYSFVNDKLLR